jgi:predicted aldo/keto reductase-like oxidoreductase
MEFSEMTIKLPQRELGKTGIKLSLLGLGGFHQCEVDSQIVAEVTNEFIAMGGNYIETARSYGNGGSEIKLGKAIAGRRNKVHLGSKTVKRDSEGAWRELNETLEALQTDYLDLYFMHNVFKPEDMSAIIAKGGALEAFNRAKQEGLIKNIAISTHWPLLLLDAIEVIPYEAVLIWGNYLDYCNYPEIPDKILPVLRERGVGHLIMKPLADGYLHNSVEKAFRYALRDNPACIVSGFNSVEMLKADAEAVCRGKLNDYETDELLAEAPELNDYVCRQCSRCSVLPDGDGDLLKKIFELEGKFDRQMNDLRPIDTGTYALRQYLGRWFGNADRAQQAFSEIENEIRNSIITQEKDFAACRYNIDAGRKMKIAVAKLSGSKVSEI